MQNLPWLAEAANPLWIVALVAAVLLACLQMLRFARAARDDRARRLEAEQTARWAGHLQSLTAALSRAMTVQDAVTATLEEFLHSLGVPAGLIALVDDSGRTASVARSIGYEQPLPDGEALALDRDTMLGRTVASREIRTAAAVRADGAAPDGTLPVAWNAGSTTAIPLLAGGRVVAVLCVHSVGTRSSSPDERDFLITGGRRAAEAMVRADHYEAAERARAEAEQLRRRADDELRERQRVEIALRESETKYRALATRTSHLYALSASLSESLTLDAVAKAIVTRSRFVAGASAGSVALLSDDRTSFETLHSEEYPPQVADAWRRFPAARGLCWTEAVQTRAPVFVNSFAEWRARFPASAALGADCGFSSLAALPLIVEDAPVGVLMFHFVAPVSFDAEYQAVLVAVAHHSAQAIDRARLYESSERARVEAETANRSKDDFLSIVSHELRTPLTAVLGWATMLRNGSLDPPRVTRAVEAIFNNATRQAQLIDELLDVSRLVGGRATFDLRELDLRDTLRGAVEAIMPLAEAKDIEICLGAHPTVPVTSDPRRLEQVFLNLLTNAVKFTPPGGRVAIDAQVNGPTVEVRVTDTGSGIDPEFLPYVFDRFRQGDSNQSRRLGGLGLGLFIARQLVEGQGGAIRAESPGPGGGSTFIVTLPVTRAIRNAPDRTALHLRT